MKVTRIKGIQGVYSCEEGPRRIGTTVASGTAVYKYPYHWACEVHGAWRPWLPGQGVPCAHVQAVLALGKERT